MKRKFPWFELVILIGLGVIFGLTYWQVKGAQRDLQQHDNESQTAISAEAIAASFLLPTGLSKPGRRGSRPGLGSQVRRCLSAELRRRIDRVVTECLSKSLKVMPAMTDGVIFQNKLSSHRSAEAKGKRRGAIKFFVSECPDCVGRFPTIFQ